MTKEEIESFFDSFKIRLPQKQREENLEKFKLILETLRKEGAPDGVTFESLPAFKEKHYKRAEKMYLEYYPQGVISINGVNLEEIGKPLLAEKYIQFLMKKLKKKFPKPALIQAEQRLAKEQEEEEMNKLLENVLKKKLE